MTTTRVDTDSIKSKFLQHLADDNERIIFSGKFGTGKTTFLNEFFEEKNNVRDKEYFTVKLYPVHYSVSSNEDIFEYVKFDILFQLLDKVEFTGPIFSKRELFPKYLLENMYSILGTFVRVIPKIDKGYEQIKKVLDLLAKDYKDFKAKENNNELVPTMDFMKEIAMKQGSPYENSCITEIINKKLEQIQDDGKKTVLLIDDFDRIDPEHTFRILNVLASQCDNDFCGGKKFCFDHIIVVCDIKNIRNIFHHKYGTDTDFTGYIDKFYSKQIFEFDIRDAFRSALGVFLSPLGVNNNSLKGSASELLQPIVDELINRGEINLRQAHNWASLRIKIPVYSLSGIAMLADDLSVIILAALTEMFGENELERIIDKYEALNLQYSIKSNLYYSAGVLFQTICHNETHFNVTNTTKCEYVIDNCRYSCTSEVFWGNHRYTLHINDITEDKNGEKVKVETFPFWSILKEAYRVRKYYITNGRAV